MQSSFLLNSVDAPIIEFKATYIGHGGVSPRSAMNNGAPGIIVTGIYVLTYANRPFQGNLGSIAIFSAFEQIMAITRLHVEGYRSIKSVWLQLKPVNVLVGANGCGKSNLYRSMFLS